jgi:hypothetical protein
MMAYLQSDLPPATVKPLVAPVGTGRVAAIAVPRRSSRVPLRLAAVALAMLMLFMVGLAAARATESLAIGIMAADLVFLLVVAGWSTVAATSTRR